MTRSALLAVTLSTLSCATHAQVPDMDPQALARFGGTWSTNCADASGPRLRIASDALEFGHRGRRVVGERVRSGYSMFGQMEPPPGFVVGFMSSALTLYAYTDPQGPYVQIVEGAPAGYEELEFRDCDAATRAAEPRVPDAAPAIPLDPKRLLDGDELLEQDQAFRRAWLAALGSRAADPWLNTLQGPRTAASMRRIAGADYHMVNSCKPHDCGANNLVLLYDVPRGTVYGLLQVSGRMIPIGRPPSVIAAALPGLLREAWGGD